MAEEKGKHEGKEQHGKEGKGHGQEKKEVRAGPKIHDEKAGSHLDIRYIVRIASKDLDGSLPVERALQGIKGVGARMAKIMAAKFVAASGIDAGMPLGKLPEDKDKVLEDIVMHPQSHEIPTWVFNRKKDTFAGKDSHVVMSDLDFALRKDLQLMMETKSYKGLRHTWGLPVRGQRTKSTHRGGGPVVGVTKKDIKAAQAPTRAGAPAGGAVVSGIAKKEEKKK